MATLQREQDEIVRAPSRGALVVQGGPGTGKTVVALHRVAYLLFAYPELARAGVLVLGPSQRFLDYIGSVLPALGETAVVSATCETLLPEVRPGRTESRRVAEVKGRALWQRVLTDLVHSLRPTPGDLTIRWEGEEYVVPEATIARLVRSACAGRSHHAARRIVHAQLVDVVTELVAHRSGELLAAAEEGLEDILTAVDANLARNDDRGVTTGASGAAVDGELSEQEVEALRSRIGVDAPFASVVQQWWPDRDPGGELTALLADEERLAALAPELDAADRRLLADEPAGWAPSDIPLLDALTDLLGDEEQPGRQADVTAARARERRDWVYGHVVVDEAQELSPMEWQMVARRSPGYSITAVGDIDQTEAPHAHTTWEDAVGEVLGERWRQSRLTICYRTPREVMALTREVLAAAGSENDPPRAVRSSGMDPWVREVDEGGLPAATATAAEELAARWTGGTVGVVAPAARVSALREALAAEVPVVSPAGAKGLEWDAVLVVDPDGIIAEPRGHNGLYVALTRCTQELGRVVVAESRG
ncbi:HelD family protein [Janibacter alittae]|uniref:AAA family ATPase n=1 Tax=Janibacter alittae TaxID=3115209 RepID=A0ABZ2MH04_9MICO